VSFHLNETTHFDQNNIVLTSRNNIKERKRKPDDLSSYCSSSSIFVPEKAARVAIFLEQLMICLSTKLDKPYTIMMT
jgi:hypothetical protein